MVSKKPAASTTSSPVADCPSGRFKLRTCKDRSYILKFDESSSKWPQFFECTAKTSAEHWGCVSAAWKWLIGNKKVIKKAVLREMKNCFLDAAEAAAGEPRTGSRASSSDEEAPSRSLDAWFDTV